MTKTLTFVVLNRFADHPVPVMRLLGKSVKDLDAWNFEFRSLWFV
jgi:hypothetical protein